MSPHRISEAMKLLSFIIKNPQERYTQENRLTIISLLAEVHRELKLILTEFKEESPEYKRVYQCMRYLAVVVNQVNYGKTHPTQILPNLRTAKKFLEEALARNEAISRMMSKSR